MKPEKPVFPDNADVLAFGSPVAIVRLANVHPVTRDRLYLVRWPNGRKQYLWLDSVAGIAAEALAKVKGVRK